MNDTALHCARSCYVHNQTYGQEIIQAELHSYEKRDSEYFPKITSVFSADVLPDTVIEVSLRCSRHRHK